MRMKLAPPMLLALTAAQFSWGDGLDDSDSREQRTSQAATGNTTLTPCSLLTMLSSQQLQSLGLLHDISQRLTSCAATATRR